MAIYARNRPTKAQVDLRESNRRVIKEVREHNERLTARAQAHSRTVLEETLKDSAIAKRLQDQLDGIHSRHSDAEAVDSAIRAIGSDNLRFKP